MNYVIIPARLESTRFPRKPLQQVDILGDGTIFKPLILLTWAACNQKPLTEIAKVVIATDSREIYDVCRAEGAEVILTGNAKNGTMRCAEAARYLIEPELIVNVQCEYPGINATSIYKRLLELENADDDDKTLISTFYYPLENKNPSKNLVKLILDSANYVQYFSRENIPHKADLYNIHICIYIYRYELLQTLFYECGDPKADIYTFGQENLEQLDWLFCCHEFKAYLHDEITGIDSPEQLKTFEKKLKNLIESLNL